VAVYSALLAPYHEQLSHAATAYVVDVVADGPPPAPRQGPAFPADVTACLVRVSRVSPGSPLSPPAWTHGFLS